jgi:hypothetical protein
LYTIDYITSIVSEEEFKDAKEITEISSRRRTDIQWPDEKEQKYKQ